MYFERLRTHRICIAGAFAFGLAGCAIRPLPENISRANTFDIVERVRCEVREVVAPYYLVNTPNTDETRHAKRIIEHAIIGFDFNFEMTEQNNETKGNLSFDRPSFKAPDKGFGLDLTGSAERKRKNIRHFRILEKLKDVLNNAKCSAADQANWVYPITGATGMGEVVSTYIKLERLTDLDKFEAEKSILPEKPVFSDVLEFTTKVNAGIKPELVLNSVAGSLRLTNASFFGSAEREDKHTLIVALASDLPAGKDHGKPDPSAAGKKFHAARKKFERVELLVKKKLVDDPRTRTSLIQAEEPAYNRVLFQLERLHNEVIKDDDEAPRQLGKRLLEMLKVP